jgi:hypothetical protein
MTHLQSLIDLDSLAAGDTVFLKCGEVWDEVSLRFDAIGSSTEEFVVTSYGTGNKPKLMGTKTLTTFSQSGNVWSKVVSTLPSHEYQNVRMSISGTVKLDRNLILLGIFIDDVFYFILNPNTLNFSS